MAKRYKGNSSSIGTATHTERKRLHQESTTRSKHKCIHYEEEIRDCSKLRISCVGPRSTLCKNYCENNPSSNRTKIEPNLVVVSKAMGIGVIIETTLTTFRVEYKNKVIRSYFRSDIKIIEKSIVYLKL